MNPLSLLEYPTAQALHWRPSQSDGFALLRNNQTVMPQYTGYTGDPLCRLCFNLAMALPGLRPLGQVWAQFMMVCR
jgi:hypothetical protein